MIEADISPMRPDPARVKGCKACRREMHRKHVYRAVGEPWLRCAGRCRGATLHSFERLVPRPGARQGVDKIYSCCVCTTERTYGCEVS